MGNPRGQPLKCHEVKKNVSSAKAKAASSSVRRAPASGSKSAAKPARAAAKPTLKSRPAATAAPARKRAPSPPARKPAKVAAAPAKKTAAKPVSKPVVTKPAMTKPAGKPAAAAKPIKSAAKSAPPAKTPKIAPVAAPRAVALQVSEAQAATPVPPAAPPPTPEITTPEPSAPLAPVAVVPSAPAVTEAPRPPAPAPEPAAAPPARAEAAEPEPKLAQGRPERMEQDNVPQQSHPMRPSLPPGRQLPPRPMAKAEIFEEGDHVVYPTHGVGKVERIATEEIAGHKLELIHITFEENRMTLRVPVSKARTAGLRKLATRKLFDEALAVLRGRARVKRTMWSRRAQEYEAKINSGDPLAIAEVVRDLHRNAGQPDQSFSERQIYEAAMDRLAAELAALDKTDKVTAATKLSEFLKTVV